jgi:hypothetical protein
VIKVVTRKDWQNEVNLLLGRNDLAVASGYGHFQLAQGDLTLAVEKRNDSGYQAEAKNFRNIPAFLENGMLKLDDDGQIKRAQQHLSGLLKYRHDGFGFTAQAFQSTDTGVTNAWLGSPHTREETGQLLASHYSVERDQWQYKIYGDVNRYYYRSDVTDLLTTTSIGSFFIPPISGDGRFEFENDGRDNYRFKAGASASGQLFESLRLDIGVENELRSSERFIITDDIGGASYTAITGAPTTTLFNAAKVREISTYGQLDHQQGAWRFTLGARHTDNGDYGARITPKASMVYQFDQQQSLKLLFSEGFNSPTLAQNRVVDEFGEPTSSVLDAETIQSSDIAYTWSDSNHNFVSNIFNVEATKLIQRAYGGGFNNADNIIRRQGIEFDYKYSSYQWQVFASTHYLKQGDKEIVGDPSAKITPAITASLGVSYQLGEHQFGFSERYIGKRANIAAYNLLNISYNRRIGPLNLSLEVQNLLDETAMHQNSKFLSFPLQMSSVQGRALHVGVRYLFD